MSSYDETDALVLPGARVLTRPGVTLITAPVAGPSASPPALPSPPSPQPASTSPSAPGLHPIQPQPAATDALVPPGVRVPQRPGIALIPAPVAVRPSTRVVVQPQPATDALVPPGGRVLQRPGVTLISAPAMASPPQPGLGATQPSTDALVPPGVGLRDGYGAPGSRFLQVHPGGPVPPTSVQVGGIQFSIARQLVPGLVEVRVTVDASELGKARTGASVTVQAGSSAAHSYPFLDPSKTVTVPVWTGQQVSVSVTRMGIDVHFGLPESKRVEPHITYGLGGFGVVAPVVEEKGPAPFPEADPSSDVSRAQVRVVQYGGVAFLEVVGR